MNTWNCTRCETPHDAPALVMSESGLPFCNDLCKTAYERDLAVGEMCAQFDETSKRIAEWREARELVFERLREPLKPTFNLERLIRRESELTASVHELLAVLDMIMPYTGNLGDKIQKVYNVCNRAQALVNEESYNVR